MRILKLKIVFIGCVKSSEIFLRTLIEHKFNIIGVVTKEKSSFNSDFCDLSDLCNKKNVDYIYANNINDTEIIEYIADKQPDIIYCFGWSQLIKKDILRIPPKGIVGFHPAELPFNRGRHPIIWALFLGLQNTASPHADDEVLGAGGTILKYKDVGWNIYWLNVTSVKEEYGFSAEIVSKREKEIQKVNELFRFDDFFNLSLKPANLDLYNMSDLIVKFSSVISKIKPNVIMMPFQYDVHSDHRIVFETIYSCTKSFRYPYIKKVLCMEILSETDFASSDSGFVPNYFVNITKYIDKKINIMQVYKSEIAKPPFPRSLENIKALSRVRGSSCGCEFAEGFRLLKCVEN